MLLEEEEEEKVISSAELSISKDNPETHSRLVKEIEKMLKTLMIDYNESIIIQMNPREPPRQNQYENETFTDRQSIKDSQF